MFFLSGEFLFACQVGSDITDPLKISLIQTPFEESNHVFLWLYLLIRYLVVTDLHSCLLSIGYVLYVLRVYSSYILILVPPESSTVPKKYSIYIYFYVEFECIIQN